MNRVARLSRIFQLLCTAAFILLGAATVALGWVVIHSEYHAMRILYLFNANYSHLVIMLRRDWQSSAAVAVLLWVIPWLAGLFACRRIFASFAQGAGFQRSTPKGFRALALVLWSTIPADYLLSPSVFNTWRKLLFLLHSRALFLGLAFLLFAAIMDEACRLQDEQDLVV